MNKRSLIPIFAIIAMCICGFVGGYYFSNKVTKPKIEKVDSVKVYKDTITKYIDKIDTVRITLSETNREYEETVDFLISNSPDSSYVFFIDYIESQRSRIDSVISDRR